MDEGPWLPPPEPPSELKRSSWMAGMPGDFQVAPYGSPASWQKDSVDGLRGRASPTLSARSNSPNRLLSVPLEDPKMAPPRNVSPLRNPFNFETQYVPTSPVLRPSQRRGHHYKHSSVSINFFQEPEIRAPLSIPVSLAIPTLRECYQSITREQVWQLSYAASRVALAVMVYISAQHDVHSKSTLAHMFAYNAVVTLAVACMNVLSNFDVWTRSSLRLPFALQRTEVLVGFELGVVLVFVGGDVISHTIQEAAEYLYQTSVSSHGHLHDMHNEGNGGPNIWIFMGLFLDVLQVYRDGLENLWTSNLMLVATIVSSVLVLLVPWLGKIVDSLLTPGMGLAMVLLGWTAAKLFGGMLVMSFGGPDHSKAIAKKVHEDKSVIDVSDISLWQVHHDLWLASMRIAIEGSSVDERRVRELATFAIKNITEPDTGVVRWDTTIEVVRKR